MDRACRALAAQLKLSWGGEPEQHILFHADENDIRRWYALIFGLPEHFFGGEYLIELTANDEFPSKPPAFKVLTPNGSYETDCFICISVGEFHARDYRSADRDPHKAFGWRPALGMAGFARECMNGLIAPVAHGLNVRTSTKTAEYQRLAAQSEAWNKQHYPVLMRSFDELLARHPDHPGVKRLHLSRALVAGRPELLFPRQDVRDLDRLRNVEFVPAMLALNANDPDKLAKAYSLWKKGPITPNLREAIIASSQGDIDRAAELLG